jgi:hypothetical protein
MKPIILDNGNLRLSFNPENGALCGLTAPKLGWDILDRPELGLSFRLLVPLGEEKRNNPVHGEKQKLTDYKLSQDGKSIQLTWDGVTSEHTGKLEIKVSITVTLEDEEAVFSTQIENHSPYQVESVWSPYLGDVKHPPQAKWFKTFQYVYATASTAELWPHFQNHKGYFGVDYPTQISSSSLTGGTPSSPYILMRDENCGLYCGVKANSSELVAWHAELRPGYGSSIDASVPPSQQIAGKPVHTLFGAVHMPYIQPGETRNLTPIALKAYSGGWQQGVDIYKAWRESWMKPYTPPHWAAEPHAWQQLHINSPEDELRLRFVDLPKVAEECARYGVKAIQLVGWNNGGQDQGNPSHDFDPRLGTYEELKNAIAECHMLGVKIILFSKFIWADRGTAWFRRELIKYAVKDPYGDYYMHGGYHYQTPAQLMDINTKRLIPMCFLSGEYRKIAQKEFLKLVDLGAAGMLFDECLHHQPSWLCFDESHGHRYGAPAYQNDRLLIEEFRKLPGVPDDFLMAGEACYDWEMEQYQVSYHRSENKEHIPLSRYMLPHAQFMTAITGFNDRNMLNQCLMYRYIISYEPYNFKGRLPDYPDTMAYGVQVDKLRTELRKWFWDGEFRYTCGAKVHTGDGKAFETYSVFKAGDGSIGIIAVNYEDQPVTIEIAPDSGVLARYRLVDCDDWKDASVVEIPGQSAAVVIY